MSGAPARSEGLGRKPRSRRTVQASMLAYDTDYYDYDHTDESDNATADHRLLADIGYGPRHQRSSSNPRRIVIGTPPIGGCNRERWRLSTGPVTSGWSGDIGYVHSGDYLFAHLLIDEPAGNDLAQLTRAAYGRLLAFVRDSQCPELLRIWNYLPGINEQERGLERYQAFCLGRFQAFNDADIPACKFPAATAIGSPAQGLSVHLLASRQPGTPIENPRQIRAYEYPLPYSPRPPSFARAMRYIGPQQSRELAISGTASIVGHVTMHPHNLGRQLHETLRNLDILREQGQGSLHGLSNPRLLLKVYLRDPGRLPEIAPRLLEWAGAQSRIMYLQGAICRRALEIEIEAHSSAPHASPNRITRIEPASY